MSSLAYWVVAIPRGLQNRRTELESKVSYLYPSKPLWNAGLRALMVLPIQRSFPLTSRTWNPFAISHGSALPNRVSGGRQRSPFRDHVTLVGHLMSAIYTTRL
jgi:hypothetical protein